MTSLKTLLFSALLNAVAQKTIISGQEIDTDVIAEATGEFASLFEKCYDPKVTLEQIIELSREVNDVYKIDFDLELATLKKAIQRKLTSVKELSFISSNPCSFSAEEIKEIIEEVTQGSEIPFVERLLGADFALSQKSRQELEDSIQKAQNLRGLSFVQSAAQPNRILSSIPVTYKFIGGNSDRTVINASFYSAAYICNEMSRADGLYPAYRFVQKVKLGNDYNLHRIEKIQFCQQVISGELNEVAAHEFSMEHQLKLQSFIFWNDLGKWWAGQGYDEEKFDVKAIRKHLKSLQEIEDIVEVDGTYDIQLVKKANGYRIARLEDCEDCEDFSNLLCENRVEGGEDYFEFGFEEDCGDEIKEEKIRESKRYSFSKEIDAVTLKIGANAPQIDDPFFYVKTKESKKYCFKVTRGRFMTRKQFNRNI